MLKKIKTVISLIVMLAIVASCVSFQISAAETPMFSLNRVKGNTGDEVYLELTCSNNPGINGWALTISYDSSALELVNTDNDSAFGDITTSQELSTNPFRVQWYGLNDVTTDGKMLGLFFKIKENAVAGDYNVVISYDETEIANQNDELVHFDTSDGVITVLAKHTHSLTKIEAKPSTCTEQGNNEYYYCEGCGTYFKDSDAAVETTEDAEKLPLADHNYIENADNHYLKTPATCTEKAIYYKSCSVCGQASEDTFEYGETAAHSYDNSVWKSDGTGHWHECKVCGSRIDFSQHTSSGAATEETPEVCTECGYVITPALEHEHTLKLVEEKAPDCVTEGNKAYYVCEGCGKWFEDENAETEITDQSSVVIPAKGHSYVWKYDEKIHWQECEVCGVVTKSEEHIKSETIVDAAPTEDKEGKGHTKCKVCGARLSEEVIPKVVEGTKPTGETQPNGETKPTSVVINNPEGKGVVNTGTPRTVFTFFAVIAVAAAGVFVVLNYRRGKAAK